MFMAYLWPKYAITLFYYDYNYTASVTTYAIKSWMAYTVMQMIKNGNIV